MDHSDANEFRPDEASTTSLYHNLRFSQVDQGLDTIITGAVCSQSSFGASFPTAQVLLTTSCMHVPLLGIALDAGLELRHAKERIGKFPGEIDADRVIVISPCGC